MKLPTLYSRASTGALREWTIEISDVGYRTHSGVVGKKITTSDWYLVEGSNVGRANEKSVSAQAEFNGRQAWKKRTETGYFEDPKAVDNSVGYVEPMLAKKWEDRADTVSFPVYAQPKYDGMRCIITADSATSRNGKDWKTIPHILELLEPIFEAHPDLILDGELYNHEFHDDFNKITSLAKKTKPTEADLAESRAKLKFYWYDIVDVGAKFSDRLKLRREILDSLGDDQDFIVDVPTYECGSLDDLDALYGSFMDSGYEGQMVRLNTVYECKRSNGLLKRKEFTDDEYLIIDVCEGKGNRSGMAGYMILQRPDGVTFNSNIKGTFDLLRDYLLRKQELIGQYATCKYFNLTPDGIPRFPFVMKIRSGVGID